MAGDGGDRQEDAEGSWFTLRNKVSSASQDLGGQLYRGMGRLRRQATSREPRDDEHDGDEDEEAEEDTGMLELSFSLVEPDVDAAVDEQPPAVTSAAATGTAGSAGTDAADAAGVDAAGRSAALEAAAVAAQAVAEFELELEPEPEPAPPSEPTDPLAPKSDGKLIVAVLRCTVRKVHIGSSAF